ncbi:MAG: hypothetical protein IKI58_01535 [Oscillospiraceae bacterium]|nr:hypothetical protein [Oscillospiraceae bacterium]
MASIYTDEERTARYAKLRQKKRVYEKIFDICMIAAIIFGLFAVRDFLLVLIAGLMRLSLPSILVSLFGLVCTFGTVIAVYLKQIRVSAAVLFLCLFFSFLGIYNGITPLAVICGVTAVTDYYWYRLSQEEGFPLFDFSYEEQQEREKVLQRYTENRAIEAGLRANPDAQGEADSEMTDLLDETLQPVPAVPAGYKSRYENAHVYEKRIEYQPGVMDSVEDAAPQEPAAKSPDDDILQPM